MPRASRLPLSPQVLQELQKNILFLFTSLRTEHASQAFYTNFFTPEEQMMITKRLMLFMMLEKGCEIKDIVAVLGVSKETVRIYEHSWTAKSNDFKELLRTMLKHEQGRKLWEDITRLLKPFNLALEAKHDMKSRAKLLQGDFE